MASAAPATADSSRPAAAVEFPRDQILRPLTLPQPWMQAGFGYRDDGAMFVRGAGGVTDWLELEAGGTSDGVLAGVSLGLLARRGALDLALHARSDFEDSYGIGGLELRARINDRVAFRLPPSQLHVVRDPGNDETDVRVKLPVAVGLQAAPGTYLEMQLELADIGVTSGPREYFFVDQTEVAVLAMLSLWRRLELGGAVSAEALDKPGDDLTWWLLARASVCPGCAR